MGALQKIRNRGGLLIAVLGVALLFFILGEFVSSGNTWINKFRDKAFTVDGSVVSTGEFQNRVNQFEDFQKFVSGQTSLDENVRGQISEFVYEQMVKEMILDEQADKLGLTVTKEEMNDMAYGENISPILLQLPIFTDPQTRQFSHEALTQFLTFIKTDVNSVPDEQKMQLLSFQQQWRVIENMMKYYKLEEKYNTLISSAIVTNDVEAKANFEGSKSAASIVYAVSRYSLIPDSTVTVSDKEVEALYKERKNTYKIPSELRKVSYIVKQIAPSEADDKAVKDQMDVVYEKMQTTSNPALLVAEYSDVPYQDVFFSQSMLGPEELQFAQSAAIGDVHRAERQDNIYRLYKLVDRTSAPDSVQIQMIFIPKGADTAIANTQADSIMNVIKGGKEFDAVARELNPQSIPVWATEPMLASMGDNFTRSVFRASKGETLRMSEGNAIQIIKVIDVTRPVAKYKLALVQMPISVSDKTIMDIDNDLNKFVSDNTNPANFYKAAVEKEYNVIPDITVAPSSLGLPQVEGSRQVIHWAFNEKVGSIKKFDLSDYRIVAVVNEAIEGGFMPLKDVSDALKAELIRDKKAEKIIADLKAANQTSLDGYAQAMNSRIDTVNFVRFTTPSISALGREPIFNVYAKNGELNAVQGPLKGNTGVFVLSPISRVEDQTEFNPTQIKNSLDQTNRYRFNSMLVFNVLKEKLEVVDNRVKFF